WLLAVSNDSPEVCDWRAYQVPVQQGDKSDKFSGYDQGWFTPDGKRFAVIWRSTLTEYTMKGGITTGRRIDDEIQLFDIASQKKIASFTPKRRGLGSLVHALAMSYDGKSFAVWTGTEVGVLDFHAAFGVAPLTPG